MAEKIPTVRAPELAQPGVTWVNTARPLTLKELRGRLVILDFWTFCCVNCLQLLPTLAAVEARYGERVAVIGIHSPKFAAERDPAKVAAAIRRHGITHPVAHDPDFRIWQQYTVRAWPTLVFIAPDGYVLGSAAGEPDPDRLVEGIGKLLGGGSAADPAPLPLDRSPEPPSRFRFPAKLKAVGDGRWALADAGHHQIVLLDAAGAELARFGSGIAGLADGPAAEARFSSPQGLAADPAQIVVADTGNHALRRIDLASGTVTQLAGSGRRGRVLTAAPSPAADLASPWDVALLPQGIAFANAGTHQLGLLDAAGAVAALAGSGREGILDGPAAEAALAQPSALALSPDGASLYFLDSETSSLRRLHLAEARVETLIGSGLFDFGHDNGAFAEAMLQHPLGLAIAGDRLYIADSYNDTVRLATLASGMVGDLDDGFLCEDPVCMPLSEPAGLALDGATRLLLVDTNHHRIVAYDLAARRSRTWAG